MAIKSFRDRSPVVVGVTCLVILGMMATAAFLTGTLGLLKNRYEMSGVFADAGGLRGGDDVLVAGVRVGQVTAVQPRFRAGHVLVRWKVDHGIALGPRTRAEIRMANILGGRYLRLTGPVTRPYMEGLPPDRRRIPLDRTRPPTTVNELITANTRSLGKLDAETFDRLLDRMGGFSGGNRQKIMRSFRNLSAVAGDLNAGNARITELLDGGDRLLRIAREKDAALSRLVSNAMILLDTLRKRRDQLAILLGAGDRTVRSTDRLISSRQASLITMITDLRKTMDRLDPHVSEVNSSLAWTGPTLHGLSGIADQGDFLDGALSQVGQLSPTDLARLSTMLKGAGR